MKLTIHSTSKTGSYFAIYSVIFTLNFIGCIILYGNSTSRIKDIFPRNPYKITAYSSCLPTTSNNLATIQPIRSGPWNRNSTWPNGIKPTINDDVVVPKGTTLTLIGNCDAKSLKINGTLRASNQQSQGTWFNLTTKYIMVMGSDAVMEIGTKNNPYISNQGGTITLVGSNRNELIPGTTVNSKAIIAMNGATINLHGISKKSWVKIGGQTPAGSTDISLAEAINWRVGDRMVITSNRLNPDEAEERVITAISEDKKRIFFSNPLKFPRMGQLQNYSNGSRNWTMDTRAEVGLLSRNITIQGDENTTDTNRYGAHVMIMKGSVGNADNVAFYRMGQGGILGRYPWHWHLLSNGGYGQYISNCSIWKSYNRAITVHGTWGTLVDNNVAYDHRGHGIFLEDGSEIDNTFSNNLVLLSKKPNKNDALLDSDFDFTSRQNASPSSFWITNPDNTFVNNIVAGTEGSAYWFAFPDAPTGNSESLPALANLKPRKTELKEFSGNSAHSSFVAIDINDGLTSSHRLRKNVGFDTNDPFTIKDFTVFSNNLNLYAGIGGGDVQAHRENIIFDNTMSSDSKNHTMFATRAIVKNSIFISDTGNELYTSNAQKSMNVLYDGALRIYDSHFVDFHTEDASLFENAGAGSKIINHLFRGITYNHNGPARVNIVESREPNNNERASVCLQAWSNVIVDLDGSLTRTGIPSSLVTDTDFYVLNDAHQPYNWEGLHSVNNQFVLLEIQNDVPLSMTTRNLNCGISKFLKTGACTVGMESQHHLALNDQNNQYEHAIYYSKLSGKSFRVKMDSEQESGKALVVRFKGFGNLNGVRIDGIAAKNTINQVKNSNTTAYYVEPNGDLYVQFITSNSFMGRNYTIRWNSGNLPSLNVYDEEPNMMNASVTTSNQSDCNAKVTFHIENNPNKTRLEVSLDGGETYNETINDNIGKVDFNNVAVGNIIYARWVGQNCGQPIHFVKNKENNVSCSTIDIPNQKPFVNLISPTEGATFGIDQEISLTAEGYDLDGEIKRYSFFYNGRLISSLTDGSNSLTRSFSTPGTYNLTVRAADDDGAVTASSPVTIIVYDSALSVNTIAEKDTGLKLHPNPMNNTLFVSNDTDHTNKVVEIYNFLGTLKLTRKLGKTENAIDVSGLSNGLYLVHVSELGARSNTQKIYKIIKGN